MSYYMYSHGQLQVRVGPCSIHTYAETDGGNRVESSRIRIGNRVPTVQGKQTLALYTYVYVFPAGIASSYVWHRGLVFCFELARRINLRRDVPTYVYRLWFILLFFT